MIKLKFVILCFSVLFQINGQQITDAEYYRRMDLGEDLMKNGKYEAAQEEFMFILNNMKVLPTDLAYLFGRNSFHLNQFKQSINWLNKYIQIKGTMGRYYSDAVKYLQFSEDKYLEIARSNNDKTIQELGTEDYDCGGLEKMICPVCKGTGVLIKKGLFENTYSTGPYCAGEGYLSCEEYNLFMLGKLSVKIQY